MTTDASQSTDELSAPQDIQCNVTFENKSHKSGTAIIFQKYPDEYMPVVSLAWLAQHSSSNSNTEFNWQLSYCFVWTQSNCLEPGVIFEPAQVYSCDPYDNNSIILGPHGFGQIRDSGQRDTLTIATEASIPHSGYGAGFGMAGAPTFVAIVQPNMTFQVKARPEYWIALGNFEKGEVLDRSISNAAQIGIDPGRTSYKVTLNPDNTWTIKLR